MLNNRFFTYPNFIKLLISGLFIMPLILVNDFIFPFIVPKILFLRSIILLMLAAYIILLLSDFQRFRPKMSGLTIGILLFLLSFAISTFVGVDWYRSFWDNHERMLGLFTMVHYVLLYLVSSSVLTSEKDWTFVFRTALILGSVIMLIGIWQRFVNPEALLNRGSLRVSATLGNAIYYSGYGLFLTFLGAIQYYREGRRGIWAYISIVAGILGFIGIFLGGTRGTLLGLLVGGTVLIMCYGFLSKNKNKLTRIARYAAILGVITFGVLFTFRTSPFVLKIPLLGQLLNTSFSSGTAGTRVMSWKIALTATKEKPIFGWGPNNFYYAFNQHYNPQFLEHGWGETWFDNAHSVIFNTLAVQGIFGILAYLSIYVAAIALLYLGIRRSQVNQHVGFFSIAFLIAHLVGLVTVFENPTSYLYFFVFLGFTAFLTSSVRLRTPKPADSDDEKSITQGAQMKMPAIVSVLVWIAILTTIFITDLSPARANKATVIAMQKIYTGVADGALYDEPLSFATPHIDDIRNDLSRIVFENIPKMLEAKKTVQVSGLFDRSVTELKKNQLLHPRDVRVHYTLSQFYNMGYQLTQKAEMLRQSGVELERSLEFSPRRQQFEYSLAFNYLDQGRVKEAEEILKQSIENDPKIAEGWWRLAVLYQYEISSSTASATIDEALKRGIVFDDNAKNVLKQVGIILP